MKASGDSVVISDSSHLKSTLIDTSYMTAVGNIIPELVIKKRLEMIESIESLEIIEE